MCACPQVLEGREGQSGKQPSCIAWCFQYRPCALLLRLLGQRRAAPPVIICSLHKHVYLILIIRMLRCQGRLGPRTSEHVPRLHA